MAWFHILCFLCFVYIRIHIGIALCSTKKIKTTIFSNSFFFLQFHNKSFIYGLKSKKIIVLCVFVSDSFLIEIPFQPFRARYILPFYHATFNQNCKKSRNQCCFSSSVGFFFFFLSLLPKRHCMHFLENCYKYLICLLEVECQTIGQNVHAHVYL